MKFKDLKYERLAYEDLKAEFEKLLGRLKAAENAKQFMEVFDEINTFRGHISSMQTLCSIRHTIDTADEFYDKENASKGQKDLKANIDKDLERLKERRSI